MSCSAVCVGVAVFAVCYTSVSDLMLVLSSPLTSCKSFFNVISHVLYVTSLYSLSMS